MREDEHPQEAEHIQKRSNTQISDQKTEMDDEMAKMAQKHKDDTKKRIEDKNSTKVWVQEDCVLLFVPKENCDYQGI